MAGAPVRFYDLRGTLPGGWSPTQVEIPGDGAVCCAWGASGGRYLQLDHWPGWPPSPGKPMQAAGRWPVSVGAVPAELLQTVTFRGVADEVFVVYLTRGTQHYRLFARHESRARVTALLAALRWADAPPAPAGGR